MFKLAWANLKRRTLRSAISVLAITFIILMIVSVFALAGGLTDEVGQRMSSVAAELIVLPKGVNLAILEGEGFGAKDPARIAAVKLPDGRPAVGEVIPVYVKVTRMGGQDQRIYGIDPAQWRYFGGQRQLVGGRLMSDAFDRRIEAMLDAEDFYYDPRAVTDAQLAEGLEVLIDKRLEAARRRERDGEADDPDTARIKDHDFRIAGVVESGVIGRIFMPLATMRHVYAGGQQVATCCFVKLAEGVDRDAAAEAIEAHAPFTVLVTEKITQRLRHDLRLMFIAIHSITAVSLVVGLGVIVLTIYTMILERRREIAILKSLGAGPLRLVGQVLVESLMLCLPGTLLGIGLSYALAAGIMAWNPLFTVTIAPWLWGLAIGAGVGLSVAAALLCGAGAARQDAVMTLAME